MDHVSIRPRRGRLWRAFAEAPFQMPITIWLGAYGLVSLLSGRGLVPRTVDVTLPPWLVLVWTAGITFGCIAAVVARLIAHEPTEQVGLVGLTYGAFLYAAIVSTVAWPAGILAGAAFAAVGTGAAVRLRVLHKDRKARRAAARYLNRGQ